MSTVNQVEIQTGIFYEIHPDHRNKTRNKSQWIIKIEEERSCFNKTIENSWINKNVGWGLHFENDILSYLGFAQDHITKIFIAKFVDGSNSNHWHGYPADHHRNNDDIPSQKILHLWLDAKVLSSPKIRKILRGQPCSL